MPAKPTAVLIAEGLLWEPGVGFCPGPLLPEAAARLTKALATHRVVVVTPCASHDTGAKFCKGVLEQMGFGLGPDLDLHVGFGFPVFDKLIAEGCCDE